MSRRVQTRPLPSGLVTFLFTDIEGSTQRWEERGAVMARALQQHDYIIRNAIDASGGSVFKSVGDQFCAVFSRTSDAARAAVDAQRAFAAQDWSGVGGLRVRMALHTASAEERDGDYFGPAVNRVARMLAAGHGGQILLSASAAETLRDDLAPSLKLLDLGTHQLRDIRRPEHLYQIAAPGLPQTFPPLRLAEAATNLPSQVTSFVGRELEMRALRGALSMYRLVTLAGAGGVGKTRTSIQVALASADTFPDGAWFVDLASTGDESHIEGIIAAALGVEARTDPLGAAARFLRERHALVVFDNCEHVVEAAARAAEHLLQHCPNVHILATTREPLRIAGEHVYRLTPLPPDAAMALFADRARSVHPQFSLTPRTTALVRDVITQLDGIPLAIELAAARTAAMPIDVLARRLSDRFDLLRSGSRTAMPRQQTLRAAIDWSYDLLDAGERAVLARLAVFQGSWTIDAGVAVCASMPGAVDLIAQLVEKSLVTFDGRYRLLESMRDYAAQKLDESGDASDAARRHCRYYRELAKRAYESYWHGNKFTRLAQMRVELENYRAAMHWGLAAGGDDAQNASAIVASLGQLWINSLSAEGRRLIDRALEIATGDVLRAHLLIVQAQFAFDGALGLVPAQEAMTLLQSHDERLRKAEALREFGNALSRMGRTRDGIARLEESLAISRALQVPRLTSSTLERVGFWLAYEGRYVESRAAFDEAIRIMREVGDAASIPLTNYSELLFVTGDMDAAVTMTREALALARTYNNEHGVVHAGVNLCAYLLAAGELDEAHALAREVTRLSFETSQDMMHAIALQHVSQLAARRRETETAARLLGYVNAVYDRHQHTREPTERYGFERICAILQAAYAPSRLEALQREGAALSKNEAHALASTV